MKSHKLKSTTDSYESSQYLLWLFSQLLLELHSMIFQPLDSNESVSTAEEKNRNHRLRDSSELGLNIGTGPKVNLDATFDPWLFNEDVRPTVTYMSLHVICQRCAGWRGDNRGLTLSHNVFKLILSLSLCRRKKISLRSRYFILENRRPHTLSSVGTPQLHLCAKTFSPDTFQRDSSARSFAAEAENLHMGDYRGICMPERGTTCLDVRRGSEGWWREDFPAIARQRSSVCG